LRIYFPHVTVGDLLICRLLEFRRGQNVLRLCYLKDDVIYTLEQEGLFSLLYPRKSAYHDRTYLLFCHANPASSIFHTASLIA